MTAAAAGPAELAAEGAGGAEAVDDDVRRGDGDKSQEGNGGGGGKCGAQPPTRGRTGPGAVTESTVAGDDPV
jgi:hypothetical protein